MKPLGIKARRDIRALSISSRCKVNPSEWLDLGSTDALNGKHEDVIAASS
jgi:hypothetical protein